MVIACVFALVLGLAAGSFNTVLTVRVPVGQSIVIPSSHCPRCRTPLAVVDLIPVLSYLWLQGRCRRCRAPISPLYPLTEGTTSALYVLACHQFGWTTELWIAFPLLALLVPITLMDIKYQLIPNKLTYPALLYFSCVRLVYHPEGVWTYAASFIICGGLMYLISVLSRGGMGGGDVKLMAAAGVALGWKAALLALAFASFTGGLVAIALLLTKKATPKDAIPFGPFLAFGIACAYLWGDELLMRYSSIL